MTCAATPAAPFHRLEQNRLRPQRQVRSREIRAASAVESRRGRLISAGDASRAAARKADSAPENVPDVIWTLSVGRGNLDRRNGLPRISPDHTRFPLLARRDTSSQTLCEFV